MKEYNVDKFEIERAENAIFLMNMNIKSIRPDAKDNERFVLTSIENGHWTATLKEIDPEPIKEAPIENEPVEFDPIDFEEVF